MLEGDGFARGGVGGVVECTLSSKSLSEVKMGIQRLQRLLSFRGQSKRVPMSICCSLYR